MTPRPAILARLPEHPTIKGDMLQITFSNRLEPLLERLLASLAAAPRTVFETDQVISPSAAMRRKADLAITDRFSICANVRFSFLAQWIWEQIGALLPVERNAPLTPAILAWRVLTIFGGQAFIDAHPRLAAYLSVADPVMRFDLATRSQWAQGDASPLPKPLPRSCRNRPGWPSSNSTCRRRTCNPRCSTPCGHAPATRLRRSPSASSKAI